MTEAKEEDFSLFDNVAYVNASDNILPLGEFWRLPANFTVSFVPMGSIKAKQGVFVD